jgi:hypothetical protein
MSLLKSAILLGATVALLPEQGVDAHGTGQHDAATGAVSAASPRQSETRLTVTVDPAATVAEVVRVARGAHVHLSVFGAGANALHLHGYDIAVKAAPDQPALVIFDAVHTGRFPLEMHLTDDLFGRDAKAVLYIEVHES